MRMTRNREQVYKEIINSPVPLTAYEVSKRLKDMSLTTVYRALEYLYQTGYLKRFSLDNYTYYYSSSVHRHFFRCVECGRLFPIDECHMHDYEKYLSEHFKFKIQEHFVLFSGLCEDCHKKKS
ncbi:Fur family transcriptional regulator [Fervidobacterium pennivorans subsp. shakshaketiis]|jgi:Fe2+ or Zn2+ uptake regulation protein|uniref:Fe2+/Zn2+ uptake regulation protein n=1 Tax=Fervidobacterium pennivorans (strain DSM 9078 / Ven5) TaxID=771875 RepID=H9UCP1_FERPD|nr:Fur family transcriptional regulator [Fervidobacterium pennivorans]AFG35284.1 Fe2+/Zn2+ uptake regulation protein [Fervidobacterium pennivorans DSM 9078]QIV78353.1 transcriptional repressor [Fervidobacterium pennivorans subsp. keratinolyticus]